MTQKPIRIRGRSWTPFGSNWGMPLEHPYSSMVADGTLAWSCGQCPLDQWGQVMHPDNLVAQANTVASYIVNLLGEAEVSLAHVCKLVVYYVDSGNETDVLGMLNEFIDRFGSHLLIVPIAVPPFYYEGMMIEVDVYTAEKYGNVVVYNDHNTGLSLSVLEGEELVWATVSRERLTHEIADTTSCFGALPSLIESANLSTINLLADQWYVTPHTDIEGVALAKSAGLCGNIDATIEVSSIKHCTLAELTFVNDKNLESSQPINFQKPGPATINARLRGNFFNVSAYINVGDMSLVEQTKAIMNTVNEVLRHWGLGFEHVCKSTSLYVGDSSADALHDNMIIRNSYYTRPGPASTGLRVSAFPYGDGCISISLLGTACVGITHA